MSGSNASRPESGATAGDDAVPDAAAEAASNARSWRLMKLALAWGALTLLLLWWFARSYAY
ncbi:MAG: hypothetical protein EXS13_07760 [Planctomycetes bacterium]|nr:hypothetical protein [Planctomycetota bacterium]